METDDVTIARTIVCPLQHSQRKREYLRWGIERYQEILGTMADVMVSVEPEHWQSQDTTIDHLAEEMIDIDLFYAHDRRDAAFKVAEAFGSRVSNEHEGEYPSFGHGNYIRLCSCCTGTRVCVESNDAGYGLYVRLRKKNDDDGWNGGEWFHINGGQYQYDALDAIVDGDASLGNVEIHCEGSRVAAHITYTREIEVPSPDDVPTFVGVDVGQRTLYGAAVCSRSGDVQQVEMESGDEQCHHKQRLSDKQQRRQRSGKQRRSTGVSERQKYTEHVMHRASREIVDLATDHHPAAIVLEDLTGYRESAQEANHEWPFRSLQEKICYKAQAASISVVTVDSGYTSQQCRKCGYTDEQNRSGDSFECSQCGYTVHADVNAAINIAQRGIKSVQ